MKQRYLPYLYAENDPDEVANAPRRVEIAMAMGEILVPDGVPPVRDDERARTFSTQAAVASALHSALNDLAGEAPGERVVICTGGSYIYFEREVSESQGGHITGFRSPKLSRLRLAAAGTHVTALALSDLFHDRDAWTQPTWGQRLTGFEHAVPFGAEAQRKEASGRRPAMAKATCSICGWVGEDVNPGGPSLDAMSEEPACWDEWACQDRYNMAFGSALNKDQP